MKLHDTYIGIEPYGVPIDKSPELDVLVEDARKLRPLTFEDKLEKLKDITVRSMENAYEGMLTCKDSVRRQEHEQIVYYGHSLTTALRKKSGCCRYQGTLFFVLGYEAHLGDIHRLQSAPINARANSAFNEVWNNGSKHIISIFKDSLKDKSFDYTRQNPRILDQVHEFLPGHDFFSYKIVNNNPILVSNPSRHITQEAWNELIAQL